MKKINLIYTPTRTIEEFKEAAIRARDLGATHFMAGQMPRSRWMWEEDLSNPYVNWSMGQAQIFKLKCPKALEEFLPKDHIEKCFDIFKKRCDILDKLGLKPALFSNEPFWLPEEVYRKHPDWRGARCDHPRRSTKAYYSPCIENPEILDMYRWSIKEICKETGLDYINFKTNDCGGGLSFSSGTYCGPNGAYRYRNVSMTDQVCGFIDAIYNGAVEGGVSDPVVHFSSDLELKEPEYSVNAAVLKLKDNQLINHMDKNAVNQMKVVGGTGLTETVIPEIPRNISLAKSIKSLIDSNAPIKILKLSSTDLNDAYNIFKAIKDEKPHNMQGLYSALYDAACNMIGDKYAGRLLEVWDKIDEAQIRVDDLGLDLIQYGCMHQRWINRPFVLFPEELSIEESDYYQRFQFQAQGRQHSYDLMDLQGIEGVRGFAAVFMVREIGRKAEADLNAAISILSDIEADIEDTELCEKVKMLKRRIAVYKCFVNNIVNACRFQELVDRTDKEIEPEKSLRWPISPDSRAEEFQEITRNEIDNAYELAKLCDGYMDKLFVCGSPAEEDIFTFSRELPDQLRKKAEIMLDHVTDGGRVYETNNI